jgi:phosphate transport system substrate-binding protein
MDKRSRFIPALAAIALGATLIAFGCGDKGGDGGTTGPSSTSDGKSAGITGDIKIDGSTTVYPISEMMAEDFKIANSGANSTVGKVGTGSGMKKFIAGEIDIAGASRPIKEDEDAKLKEAGIEYFEIPIAYDGVSVVVSPENNWVTDFKVA